MPECSECGDDVSMPYTCNRCGDRHCSKHRLPEKHSCSMLDRGGADSQVIVEARKESRGRKKSRLSGVTRKIGSLVPDGLSERVEGQATRIFAVTMVLVYILQFAVLIGAGPSLHNALFVLSPDKVYYVWTWFTSIFAHSPSSFMHIIGNGIILIFFGSLLEKIIGTKRYVGLFFVAGLLAGLSQIGFGILVQNPAGVLGASGALMGVLGVLTVYKPDLTVYLYFIIPLPLWLITGGYVVLSIGGLVATSGVVGGGIAHGAHLVGLIVGLVYGYRTKDRYDIANKIRLLGDTRIGG